MQLFVGQTALSGDFSRYLKQGFNFLELLAAPGRLPKRSKLTEYRERAPEGFAFSLVTPPGALEDTEDGRTRLAYAQKAASALQPRWTVLRTPSSFRPGAVSKRRLAGWSASLRPQEGILAWEPRGLWEPHQASALAEELEIDLVQQPKEFVAAERNYVRWLHLGARSRTNEFAAAELMEHAIGATECTVAVEGGNAKRLAGLLAGLLEELALDPGERLDEELLDDALSEADDGLVDGGEDAAVEESRGAEE